MFFLCAGHGPGPPGEGLTHQSGGEMTEAFPQPIASATALATAANGPAPSKGSCSCHPNTLSALCLVDS